MRFKKIIAIAWQIIKLLWKATWGLLGFVGLLVTLDSGWDGFSKDVRHSSFVNFLMHVWQALIALFTGDLIGCITLLVSVAILTHLLVEKARQRSKTEFQSQRKKRVPKGKVKKK